MRQLAILLAALFVLAFASWARAEPPAANVCRRALDMVDELHSATEHLADMRALYAQVCAERKNRRECVEQRTEIRAYEAELRQLELETLAALRACNASKATRRASVE
jgi:hypothetical protein